MNLLIKNAKIAWNTSDYHGQSLDILVRDGMIAEIGQGLVSNAAKVIEGNALYCAPGLCDIGTHSGEPGFEHRETFESLSRSAFAGGYTHLVVFPNTKPVTQTRADVQFILDNARKTGIQITPVGALSKDCKGEDIAEYLDMHSAGVTAFSDGLKAVSNAGLLKRALRYASGINASIIHHPEDNNLAGHGEMHEGNVSTGLGLSGIPEIAELSMLYRDLLLCEYTNTKLVCHSISSAGSLQLIREAIERKVPVSSTVSYLNLIFTDEALAGYDSNLKVKPVLRSADDRAALIKALSEDFIGAIVSNHVPLEEELKKVEFPYATPGATGLETCLPACITHLKQEIPVETILHKLSISPRRILGIPVPELKPGVKADLCIVDTEKSWTYTQEQNLSLSANNPFFGVDFEARVVACTYGLSGFIRKS